MPYNTDNIYNSTNFNLLNWNLTVPLDGSGGTTGAAATIASLVNYESPYFYDNPDGSMTFYAPVTGATTAGASATRSELGELNAAGTPAAWTLSQGGTMSATLAVNSLPTLANGAQGKVIIGQLEGANCALVRLYDDGGTIYFKNLLLYQGEQDTFQLTDAAGNHPAVALNQKFSYSIDAHGNTLAVKVYIGGDVYSSVTSIDSSWQAQSLHFAAGVFNDDAGKAGTALAQATGAGQATFYGLDMSHAAGAGLGALQAPVAQADNFTGVENQAVTGNVLENDSAPAGLTLAVAPVTQTTAHGSVVENADGTFNYTPAAGFSGADSFTYTVKDGSGLTATGAATITVSASAPTSPPPAGSSNLNLSHWDLTLPVDGSGGTSGTAAMISSLANYSSPYLYDNMDGSMTFYAQVSGAVAAGAAAARSELSEVNADGTPAGWTLSQGGTMSATLAVNSLPMLTTGGQGKVIIGQLEGTNCSLVRLYDDAGTIYFKNLLLYQGQQDTFQLTDAAGNHPTVALNQKFSYSIDAHGSTLTVKVYIGTDVYTSVSQLDPSWQTQSLHFMAGILNDDAGTSGTALAQASGAGQATFYGLDMSHTAGAGLGGALAPTAQADSFAGTENQVITGNVLANDSAPGGLALSVSPATQATAHGSVIENADGSFAYTPTAGFSGADSFTYTLNDGSGLTAAGTVNISVTGPNSPPVAHPDSFTGLQNQPITGNVLLNDTDPNGLALSVTPATLTTAHGSVVENANGTFTYSPAAGYVGTDSFNYTLTDTAGNSATGTANVSVSPAAGYSLVFDPSFSSVNLESAANPNGAWDTTFIFGGRTLASNNEAEYYSDPSVGVNPFSVNNGVLTITAAAASAATLATDGGLPYTSGLLTTATSFAQTYGLYEISAKLPAGQGLWPALWLLPASGAWPPEIDILEALGNAPATDYMTLHTGTSNTALGSTTQVPTATTAFNTYAVDWEPSTITFFVNGKQVFQEPTPSDMHQPMYLLMNLAVGGNGSWPGSPNSSTAFPAQMQIGSVEVFASSNTIADYNKIGVQTATTPPPPPTLPPVAQPDNFTGTANHAVTGNVITNDTDPNGLALSVAAATLTTAHGGTVVQNADGTFTYTPATGFSGTDSFNYTLKDSAGLTSTGTATIAVAASVNLPPVAQPDSFTGTINHAVTGNLISNDTDPNGLALSVTAATLATAHGSVVENANGTFTYTPASGYAGTDTFTYTLKDSAGLSSTGTATVAIHAAPVALTDAFSGIEKQAVTGNVLTNDSDPAGLALGVTSATLTTAHGATVAQHADGSFTYTPTATFFGTDSFNYTLNDTAGLSSTGTVNITVAPAVYGTTGIQALNGNPTIGTFIYAGTGQDTLVGGSGNDTLVNGHASDNMTGGRGADTFVFLAANLDAGKNVITDFSASQGDKIDISNVLSGHFNAATDVLAKFFNMVSSGNGSILEVDPTGHAGASGWHQVTNVQNVTPANEAVLIAHGNLIV